jgi:hypothetical protein
MKVLNPRGEPSKGLINFLNLPARRDGPSFALRVSESVLFTARFAKVAEFAEEIFFFSAERAEKKKIYALMLNKKHIRVIK